MWCRRGRAPAPATGSRSPDASPPGCRWRQPRVPESISLHDVVGNRDVFALEVRGDSMRDEHIISGDYVLVERTRTARQGEIVVALVHGAETTLKRFYAEGNQVRLQPANIEMEPIYVQGRRGGHSGPRAGRAAQVPLSKFRCM